MRSGNFEHALGYAFTDPSLLERALTHRSYGSPHNERYEFLGDSVLNCVIACELFARFPRAREGELSRIRASLVRQDTLHKLALDLRLGDQLRLGEGELKSGGFRRPSILADALEAVIAAVYLDSGFEAARAVIERLYDKLLEECSTAAPSKDAKTALQEWLQGRRHALPEYALVEVSGEAHAQQFEVECAVPALGMSARGSGSSRRSAEQEAARRVLERLAK